MPLTTAPTTDPRIDRLAATVMQDGWFDWQKDGRTIHKILNLLLPKAPIQAKKRREFLVNALIDLDKRFNWKMAKKTQSLEEATYGQFVSLWLDHPDVRASLDQPKG